jgi:hypothetical protein
METKFSKIKPLIIFFFVAFILAWSLMGLTVAQNYGWIELAIPFEPILLIGSWIPNIAAFLVIAFVLKRKGGIKNCLKAGRSLKCRLFGIWLLFLP